MPDGTGQGPDHRGIGTGKTTVLAAARDTLRRSGLTVLACPPPDGEPPETALVIDDAQLLTDTELLRLTERVADSRLTVVAAAEAASTTGHYEP